MKQQTPLLILIAFVLLIPAALIVERSNPDVWNNRLLIPFFENRINLHTPLHPLGTFLPPTISKNMTLTEKNNPVIIPRETRIAKGVTVTLEEGTRVFAHEYALLEVDGNLIVNGTTEKPVTFDTNEMNTQNQTWGGIIFSANSTGAINHVTIRHASPAFSCLAQSHANISNADIALGNLGLFAETSNCSLINSAIDHVLDGVITVNAAPNLADTTVNAKRNPTKEIIR